MHTGPRLSTLQSLFIPATSAQASVADSKLLVVLHGLGDSLEGYRFLPEFLDQKDLNYLLLNAPDSYYMGYSWFPFPGDTATGIIRSRGLLIQVMQELLAIGYKSENIGFFGFSQGAVMTLDFVLRSQWKIAGAVAVSGFAAFIEEYPQALSALAKQQKIFMDHGTFDGVIPIAMPKPQAHALQKMGLGLTWKEYAKDHTIDAMDERRDIQSFLQLCFGAP